MKNIFTTLILLMCGVVMFAQEFDRERMDEFFNTLSKEGQAMGSISITFEGDEVYKNAIGLANIEQEIEATPKTKYHIGSISKTFTAFIIMQLVEEEKLSLKTTLNEFYPEFENANNITIEMLLRHRSGLYNFTNAEDYLEFCINPIEREELLIKMIEGGTVFKPDTKAEYSNTNYVLLTYIAEKVELQDFGQIFTQRVVEALELEDTHYGGQIEDIDNAAYSYTKLKEWEQSIITNLSIPAGAGAVVSTAHDVNKFYGALFSGEFLSEESLNQMKKMVDGFGIGMFTFPFYEDMAYGHTGGIDGFQSMTGYFPEKNVTITYLSNGVVYPVNDIMIGALSIFFNKDYEIPTFEPKIEVSEEDLESYDGIYSADNFPLKITITHKDGTLIAQASGQPSFPMDAVGNHEFKFDAARLKIVFQPKEKTLVLFQGGMEIKMNKE